MTRPRRALGVGTTINLVTATIALFPVALLGIAFATMHATAVEARQPIALSFRRSAAIAEMRTTARSVILTLDASARSETTDELDKIRDRERFFATTLASLPRTRGNVAQLARVEDLFDDAAVEGHAYVLTRAAQNWVAAAERGKRFSRAASRLEDELDGLLSIEHSVTQTKLDALEKFVAERQTLLGAGMLGIVVLALGLTYLLRRLVLRPIRLIQEAACGVAKTGSLAVNVPEAGCAELADLAASYRAMMERVREAQQRFSDVTIRLDELVRQRTDVLYALAESADSRLFVVGPALTMLVGFPRFFRDVVGVPFEQGASVLAVLGLQGEAATAFRAAMARVFDGTVSNAVEHVPRRHRFVDRDMLLDVSALRDEAGNVIGVLFCAAENSAQLRVVEGAGCTS